MCTNVFELWENVPLFSGAHTPTLDYYKAENRKGNGTVIILPGGAYRGRAAHEGKGYAEYLNVQGLDCFVLQYRVSPDRFPAPLLDARRAVRFIRANAEKFGIDPNKIAVMGSSAGGHLAAFLSTYKKKIDGEGVDATDEFNYLPNAQILCYPVIDYKGHSGSFRNLLGENASESCSDFFPYNHVDENTPAAFIWHTSSDPGVDVNNTFRYATALHEKNVPLEMHIYPMGGHGLGLAPEQPYIQTWAEHLVNWLKLLDYVK